MVRNSRVETLTHVPRPLIALGNDYVDGHAIPRHHHHRGQLLYAATGVVMVATPQGAWVMPPQRGMWIPPGVEHDVTMLGTVQVQSLYLDPALVDAMPPQCQVVGITSFMRSLIAEAVDLPAEYDTKGRAGALMELILHELRQLPVLPLSLPFPAHGALAAQCQKFLRRPTVHATIDGWAEALGMSRRAFTRLFRREVGLSFVAWRQQACLVAALPRLAAADSITTIAIDLGYDNPAAFSTMFRRTLGVSPRDYLKSHDIA